MHNGFFFVCVWQHFGMGKSSKLYWPTQSKIKTQTDTAVACHFVKCQKGQEFTIWQVQRSQKNKSVAIIHVKQLEGLSFFSLSFGLPPLSQKCLWRSSIKYCFTPSFARLWMCHQATKEVQRVNKGRICTGHMSGQPHHVEQGKGCDCRLLNLAGPWDQSHSVIRKDRAWFREYGSEEGMQGGWS